MAIVSGNSNGGRQFLSTVEGFNNSIVVRLPLIPDTDFSYKGYVEIVLIQGGRYIHRTGKKFYGQGVVFPGLLEGSYSGYSAFAWWVFSGIIWECQTYSQT